MRKINVKIGVKTGVIILVYSLILSLCIVFSLFILFNNYSVDKPAQFPQVFFTADAQAIKDITADGTLAVNVNEAISSNDISYYYYSKYAEFIPIVVLVITLLVFVTSFLLYSLLKRVQTNDITKITKKLNSLDEDTVMNGLDPVLFDAVERIKEKVESNMEDYKRLSAYINHEQKNVLQLLRAKVEALGEDSITKTVDDLANSIDDVLTIGANTKELKPVDAALVCANACDAYIKLYENIQFDFDEDAITTVMGNELWLYRAVCNLLDNAIKYGGNSVIKVHVSSKNNSVTIAVADGGRGIEDKHIDKIFDNRFRVNSLNKNGYGIGLSLVRHVCDICGGIGIVESSKAGTVFSLAFPLALN